MRVGTARFQGSVAWRCAALAAVAVIAGSQAGCSGDQAPSPEISTVPVTDEAIQHATEAAAATQAATEGAPEAADGYTDLDLEGFPNGMIVDPDGTTRVLEDHFVFTVPEDGAGAGVQCAIFPTGFDCTAPSGVDFCESVGIASGVATLADNPTRLASFCPGEYLPTEGDRLVPLGAMQRLTVGGTACSNDGSILTCENRANGTKLQITGGDITLTVPEATAPDTESQ